LTVCAGTRINDIREIMKEYELYDEKFVKVDDLLGANYVLDIDKYSDTDYPGDNDQRQKDLRHPNRRVYEGGIIDYDFKLHVNSLRGWINNQYSKGHWDAYYGVQLTYTDFFRDGKMQNGHHANNSYGVGVRHNFTDIMLKGGLTYKLNGRHLFQVNTMYGTIAPLANDAYISARYSDETPQGLKSSPRQTLVDGRLRVFLQNLCKLRLGHQSVCSPCLNQGQARLLVFFILLG